MANVTLGGTPVETVGDLPKVGSKAPDFKLTATDLTDYNFYETTKNEITGTGASEALTNSAADVNDVFSGGAGQDTLTGNGGDDCFYFSQTSDGIDIITDFDATNGDFLDFRDIAAGELNHM